VSGSLSPDRSSGAPIRRRISIDTDVTVHASRMI
jgi:hypothetical protein